MRWTGSLATVGYAVSAIGYMLTIARLPGIAAAYAKGDPATQGPGRDLEKQPRLVRVLGLRRHRFVDALRQLGGTP